MMIGQGGNLLLQAVYFALLGRLLGSVQYGVFVGAFALTSLLATFSAMGSGTLLIRYVSTEHGRFAAYWGNVLITTTTVSAALIAGSTLIAPHVLNPASASLVLLAGIANCFCSEVTRNAAAVFQTFEKMKITAALNSFTGFSRVCAAAGMFVVLHHATVFQWAVATLAVSALAASASAITVTARYGWPTFSASLMVKKIPEGFSYSFASSTASVYNDIDKTMLSHYGMNAANGIYALAYRVIDVATIPMAAVRDAAVPRFFRDGSNDRQGLKNLTKRLTKRALVVTLLLAGVLYATAPLIPLVVGKSFAETVQAVRWLCFIPVLRSIHQMSGSAVMGMGKQNYRTASQLVVALVNLGLNLFWIPAYGWRGAAWSSLLSDALLAGCNWTLLLHLCRRRG
jgi:O-antigen/teichoic acid export membrane protein